VTKLGAGRPEASGSTPGRGEAVVYSVDFSDKICRVPSPLLFGHLGLFSGVKWLGTEADHLHPSDTKVKNEWSYTSAPPLCVHGVDRDIITIIDLQISLSKLQD
jgi:hypothetical protein